MTTPEEEFNKNVWEVLGEIESERLQTLKGKPVEYKFPVRQVVGPGIISQETEKKILYKLQEWGALKIKENPWELLRAFIPSSSRTSRKKKLKLIPNCRLFKTHRITTILRLITS